MHDAVVEEMLPFLTERFGNASSIHAFGREARRAIDLARDRVADFMGAEPTEIVFTSGGTEANNVAIRGAVDSRSASTHLITDSVEHPAVTEVFKEIEKRGAGVTTVPVDCDGLVSPDGVFNEIRDDTSLISIMLANNDVGTIQPVAEIAKNANARGVLTHTDAVQAPGKIPLDVRELGVDLLSISAHKFYGPKGSGALFIKTGTDIDPLLLGGSQERRRRAGTENVAGIVGLGKACEIAARDSATISRILSLRDRLEHGILENIDGTSVNGCLDHRLPNTTNISFEGIRAEMLLMNLDIEGIAVSAGSACASGAVEPSHVLLAMGLSKDAANSSLRFSLGRRNSEAEIVRALEALTGVVSRLRSG